MIGWFTGQSEPLGTKVMKGSKRYDNFKKTCLKAVHRDRKNREKSKISYERNTVGDFYKVTTCDDTFGFEF